jgi:hypothetical protein
MSAEERSFYQGFAVAVGTLARNGYPSMARDIMTCNGVTMEQLKEAGADKFDLGDLTDD